MSEKSGKLIVLGVTGGIAAYKAALEYKGSAYFKGAAQRAVKKLEK